MRRSTKAVLGAVLFAVLMAALQVPIIFVMAAQANGCTKYVSWKETQADLVFQLCFSAITITVTGTIIAFLFWLYRLNYRDTNVRLIGAIFVLWAVLTTIWGVWWVADCGIAHDPEHIVYFSWIGRYLGPPVFCLKLMLVFGAAYRIVLTRFETAERA